MSKSSIGDAIKSFFRMTRGAIKKFAGGIASLFKRAWQKAGAALRRLWGKVKPALKSFWAAVRARKKMVIAVSAAVLLLGLGAFVFITYQQIKDPEKVLLNPRGFTPEYDVNDEFPEHMVNIFILGFDRDEWRAERWLTEHRGLPDVIAVMSIDFENDVITVVRVPRDSYVPIHGTGGKDKINHSYEAGFFRAQRGSRDEMGISYTLQTVSNVLGKIPVHYYVTVDMDGVVQLISSMGGVWYDVPEALYDDRGSLIIHAGPQQLEGQDFLTYARHRDGRTGGDIGRIERQTELLMATFDYYKHQGFFQNIPITYRVYKDHINTNLSYKQIAALAYYAMDFERTEESVRFFSLEGRNDTMDGIWYVVLNQRQRVEMIREAFGIEVAMWPQDVLQDTPPPLPGEFSYELKEDEDDDVYVSLKWVPGDYRRPVRSENVRYELFRGEKLLLETEEGDEEGLKTSYRDREVTPGNTYTYHLVVHHYRASVEAKLTVEIEVPSVDVPDVVGMSRESAEEALKEAGLKLGTVSEQYHKDVPKGKLISQNPAAEMEVKRGSTVNIVVSKGLVPLPDVVGKSFQGAQDILREYPLNLIIEYDPGADKPDGEVILQNPAGGEGVWVAPNITVTITVSGEEPAQS